MAITFHSNRSLSTNNSAQMWYDQSLATQSFKIRIDAGPPNQRPNGLNIISRNIFYYVHKIFGNGNPTVDMNLALFGSLGSVAHDVQLTIGSTYNIVLTWDGINSRQRLYVNAIRTVLGSISGTTGTRVDSLLMGPNISNANFVYTLDDVNMWNGYVFTAQDARDLTNGIDPSTIGSGYTSRSRWTCSGPIGTNVAIGDSGVKNFYGNGNLDGTDFTTITGGGTAIYSSGLAWTPTVTSHPYVDSCGKIVAATLTLNTDGTPVTLTSLISMPTISVNGVDVGPLINPWFTGHHQCFFASTPSGVQIEPDDIVSLIAPISWGDTPAGPINAFSGVIDNRTGQSSFQVESLTKTLPVGINLPNDFALEYFPFKNAKLSMSVPGQLGKLTPSNNYQVTNSPCETGRWLLVWDATKPLTPAIMALSTTSPALTTVTHLSSFDLSPPNGTGYVRVYDVQPVPSSVWETTQGGFYVTLNYSDPAYSGISNYDNLWIYQPDEWQTVSGVPVFDRSDPYALSDVFKDRLTQNIGSIRAVDTTPCGGNPGTYPYPELLKFDSEFIWQNKFNSARVGIVSIGPLDVNQYPWIYSAEFKQPSHFYSATLSEPILTTPSVGTFETYTFPDASGAPLMAGLEIKVDNEVMRLISVNGSSVKVYRGSNGTIPTTHATGVVTVYGRRSISAMVNASGLIPGVLVSVVKTNSPHLKTSQQPWSFFGTIHIRTQDGTPINTSTLGFQHTIAADALVNYAGGYPSPAYGAAPSGVFSLDPTTNYMQTQYAVQFQMDVFSQLVSKFPNANGHFNIPMDACDDMVYKYAWLVRDNYVAGRKQYWEYCNEPWNWGFGSFGYSVTMGGLAMPFGLHTDSLSYYVWRAVRCREIIHDVMDRVGRGDEVVMMANCQMGSAEAQVTPHLEFALSLGQPFDAIGCAPYWSITSDAATIEVFSLYDDDQASAMSIHDLYYNPNNMIGYILSNYNAVQDYNAAHGKSCILMGYEGGIEYNTPFGGFLREQRNHDIYYNKHMYFVEQAVLALWQRWFDHIHIYGLGIGWPNCWGVYHTRRQKHSRGDGLNGNSDNSQLRMNPYAVPHIAPGFDYLHATVKQDLYADSPRGHAVWDWLNDLTPSSGNPPPSGNQQIFSYKHRTIIKSKNSILRIFSS